MTDTTTATETPGLSLPEATLLYGTPALTSIAVGVTAGWLPGMATYAGLQVLTYGYYRVMTRSSRRAA